MANLWFAAGSLAAFLVASAVSVALQGGAFQVLAVLSLVATLLALAGFAASGAVARHFPPRNASLLLGAATAMLFMAALWAASLAGADPRASWALVLLPPLSGAIAPWLHRVLRPYLPAWLVAAATLGGCASAPPDVCTLERPPAAAQVQASAGMGIGVATFPVTVPPGYAGCRRLWVGDPADRAGMRVLATGHYQQGRVVRFTGRQPGGQTYECRYDQGLLDARASTNAGHCPPAWELEPRE